MIILLSSNPENLSKALREHEGEGRESATVEAEYGDTIVMGSLYTLGHHGPRAHEDPPCIGPNVIDMEPGVVGLSHVDLDSVGGIMRLYGRKPTNETFWGLAGFVDVNGAHKAEDFIGANVECVGGTALDLLRAYWAFSENNRVWPERDGSVSDVTEGVEKHMDFLSMLLDESGTDEERASALQAGKDWHEKQTGTRDDGFIEVLDGVAVYVGTAFYNVFYRTPDNTVADAVVAYNPQFGSITVSFANGGEGYTSNAREIVQDLWGSEAGGHAGIAGSPRNKRMGLDDLVNARERTMMVLDDARAVK